MIQYENLPRTPLNDLRSVAAHSDTESNRSPLRNWLRNGAALGASILALMGGDVAMSGSANADTQNCTIINPTPGITICVPNGPPTIPSQPTPPTAGNEPPTPPSSPSPVPTQSTTPAPTSSEPSTTSASQQSNESDSTSNTSSSSVYLNPFRKVMQNGSLFPLRIDEGVDYKGHGNVYAIGTGIVTLATEHSSFFADDGGENIVYKLTKGRAAGLSVYVAESCTPRKKILGKRVTSGTVICYMHGDNAPWIETGWWNPKTQKPLAWSSYIPAGNPDGSETAFGVNFSSLMTSLGVPGGNTEPDHVSTNEGKIVGELPAGWPRW